MKAIETEYKGFRFRSRLEARWAVYFDAIGLKWDYEIDGFSLPSGCYLPDFWLPQVRSWCEVKPIPLNKKEMQLAKELVYGTKHDCILLVGSPDCKAYDVITNSSPWNDDGDNWAEPYVTDCALSMYHNYPVNEHRFYQSGISLEDFGPGCIFDDVPDAVIKARSERFSCEWKSQRR